VNEAADSLDDSPRLLSRKLSITSGLPQSASTDVLSTGEDREKRERETSCLHNIGTDKKRRLFTVVLGIESIYRRPTCHTGVMLLIEIEKSIIFAEHKLPGIAM